MKIDITKMSEEQKDYYEKAWKRFLKEKMLSDDMDERDRFKSIERFRTGDVNFISYPLRSGRIGKPIDENTSTKSTRQSSEESTDNT
jgi:hypothetical protein